MSERRKRAKGERPATQVNDDASERRPANGNASQRDASQLRRKQTATRANCDAANEDGANGEASERRRERVRAYVAVLRLSGGGGGGGDGSSSSSRPDGGGGRYLWGGKAGEGRSGRQDERERTATPANGNTSQRDASQLRRKQKATRANCHAANEDASERRSERTYGDARERTATPASGDASGFVRAYVAVRRLSGGGVVVAVAVETAAAAAAAAGLTAAAGGTCGAGGRKGDRADRTHASELRHQPTAMPANGTRASCDASKQQREQTAMQQTKTERTAKRAIGDASER